MERSKIAIVYGIGEVEATGSRGKGIVGSSTGSPEHILPVLAAATLGSSGTLQLAGSTCAQGCLVTCSTSRNAGFHVTAHKIGVSSPQSICGRRPHPSALERSLKCLRTMDGERERFCSALRATSWEHAQVRHVSSAMHTACAKLRASQLVQVALQETVNALLLCESVYKACDGGPQAAVEALATWKPQFGGTCTLSRVQCALPHVQHRSVASGTPPLC